jgi:hypothetical protein
MFIDLIIHVIIKAKWYSRCAFSMDIVNSLWLSTPISEHSHLTVPERRITVEFMNAQHH